MLTRHTQKGDDMNEQCKANLGTHIIQIAATFINELSEDNVIYSLDPDDSSHPDAAACHHLLELLCELDQNIFNHYCEEIFQWLADPKNHYSGHPFTLDSYTRLCSRTAENDEIFRKTLLSEQLQDGSIPVYTSMVGGGDFFSTLWAAKILVNYNKKLFSAEIEKAIKYLLQREPVAAGTASQKGFLLYILLRYDSNKYSDDITRLTEQLYDVAKDITFDGNPVQIINDLYVLEDLIEYYKIAGTNKIGELIKIKLIQLFQLEAEPTLPDSFAKWSKMKPQSPYFQALLKAATVSQIYLHITESNSLAIKLNSYLHNSYRRIKYIGLAIERVLKQYKRQYEEMENEFKYYEEALKMMWEKTSSDYEHSIFLMMPFKDDIDYRTLTETIKKTCKKLGYKVFRVDDDGRKPFDTLWDNIVLNMLGCKYGISIYVSDKAIDRMTDELRFFENPNVALEYGFMKSRAKKVLILKDISAKTPSDLQGFVWKPFDLKNPDKTVPSVVTGWIKEIKKESQKQKPVEH